MEDIKLTIEDIKKIFECFEVEGFSAYKDSCRLTFEMPCSKLITVDKKYWDSEDFRNIIPVYYPLFLQRVIEGINKSFLEEKNDRWFIETTIESIDVWDEDDRSICAVYSYDELSNMDSIKTQAIKYILDKLCS